MSVKLTGDPYEDEGFYTTEMRKSDYPWWIVTTSVGDEGAIALFYPLGNGTRRKLLCRMCWR